MADEHMDEQFLEIAGEQIVIASNNAGKVAEITTMLSPWDVVVTPAGSYNLEAPEETGVTFEENALIKSSYYAKKTGLISLADDSGLCINALGGEPGVYSARLAGEDKNFGKAMATLQERMEALDGNTDMSAYFICALSICWPDAEDYINVEGRIDGTITFPPKGEHGFGYDPIFVPDGYDIAFAQMDAKEKAKLSHRARAFEKLIQELLVD